MKTLKMSEHPEKDIQRVMYAGQPANHRIFMPGFKKFFGLIPKNINSEPRTWLTCRAMKALGAYIPGPIKRKTVAPGTFDRYILAIEKPKKITDGRGAWWLKSGKELIMGVWGKGFRAPIHGHGDGLMYERLLKGKWLENMYRLVGDWKVRVVSTTIYEGEKLMQKQLVVSQPGRPIDSNYIHDFEILEDSVSLHYIVAHSTDGTGPQYTVEHFEDFNSFKDYQFQPITKEQTKLLPIGTVALVRVESSKEYGDHFIIVDGPDGAHKIITCKSKWLEENFKPGEDAILGLCAPMQQKVREFYGITLENNKVTLADPQTWSVSVSSDPLK